MEVAVSLNRSVGNLAISPEEGVGTIGKVEEHSRGFGELHELIVRVDGHVLALDQKVDARIGALDQKVDKMSRQFTWLVGIQITLLIAVIGSLLQA